MNKPAVVFSYPTKESIKFNFDWHEYEKQCKKTEENQKEGKVNANNK